MQDFAVYLIVGAASVYLVRHWVLTSRGDKSCGGCGGCSAAKPKEEKLVQIDLGGSWKR
jgi:hypothetical protein